MFMGNQELKNTLSLTRIKLWNFKNALYQILTISFLIFIVSILSTILGVFEYKNLVVEYVISDLSSFLFVVFIVFTICFYTLYKQRNNCYSIFPQTNSSRFLSSQLTLYLWWIVYSILALTLYLAQYILFKVIARFNDNIIIAFRFDLGFVITSYFVYLLYGFLAINFISFIASFIRKFDIVAKISLLIIFAFLVNTNIYLLDLYGYTFGFFTKEGDLSIFFLKGISACLLLFIASYIINKYTSYYKTNKKRSNWIVVGVGFALIILVGIIRLRFTPELDETLRTTEYYELDNNIDSPWDTHLITLDASKIDDPSKILVTSNINADADNMLIEYDIYVHNEHGDKIVIYYRYPINIRNNYNITEVMNPNINAFLEDNVLNITYNYKKDMKVVFISPCSMMKQFDKYKNKNLFFNTPFLYTTNSDGNGSINITIE